MNIYSFYKILFFQSANTPYIQCMQKENDKITWNWGNVDDTFEKQNPNICCWMKKCFNMATTLFDLQSILSRKEGQFGFGCLPLIAQKKSTK